MLSIGQKMNDYTITAIAQQFRGQSDRPDGAYVLGLSEEDVPSGGAKWVTAFVPQQDIDPSAPATTWAWGHYFTTEQGDTALDVLADWAERAGMTAAIAAKHPSVKEAKN